MKKEGKMVKKCLFCGGEINYKKRKNKFCSRSCSTSFNNTKRKQLISEEIKQQMIYDYIHNNLIYDEIVDKYNVNFGIVRDILKGLSTSGQKIKRRNTHFKKHSDQTKKEMSEKKRKFLIDNPEKHNWKSNKKLISIPCEKLKEILKQNNISYIEEYQPLKDRFFCIDIAFPNIKLGLEVNGNQHYNKNGSLKEYYKLRKDLIEKDGWKLYDIHFSKIFDNNFINELIFELNNHSLQNVDLSFYIKDKKINKNKKQKYEDRIKLLKQKVENSNIDFSKYGWVKEVSNLLEISVNKGGWWIKKNMKNFYEEKCFKRNGGVST